MSDAALAELAEAAGLAARWQDYRSEWRDVSPEVLRRVLHQLGLPAATAAEAGDSRALLAGRPAPTMLTADAGGVLPLPAWFAAQGQIELIREETGERTQLPVMPGDRPWVTAPKRPGYYQVQAGRSALCLAVAPASCLPVALHGQRRWGLSAPVYGLRRDGDSGFGDFTALAKLARWAGTEGADALAISPVHALYAADSRQFSPYSPSSRLFLNVLYGDPRTVFEELPTASAGEGQQHFIDWPASATTRLAALRAAHQRMASRLESRSALAQAFAAFVGAGGQRLVDHARFEALCVQSRQRGGHCGWQDWPEGFHDPRSAAVEAFAEEHAAEVQFHLFAQWLAARGLANAQLTARDAGMAVGLIGDLAVGTEPGGSHAWSLQDAMLQGLSVGAPPDLLAGQGQNWGLTTFSPFALREQGYRPFIELLRANLHHVGGLRIDHILGLHRLWLVPSGGSATEGVYLRYPVVDLLRLIRLEAWRHHALVIGEDLGTVPQGLREQLEDGGILGMRVLWFERDHRLFVEPERWSAKAMATTTTHDLPTVAGWWQGRDLDWRVSAGQFGADSSEAVERGWRGEDRALLWAAFRHQGLVTGEGPEAEAVPVLNDAAIDFVARTPAPLALIPIEDLMGVVEQPNVPGTVDEHPNWRRRLPIAVEALDAEPTLLARTARLRQARPRP